MKQTLIFKMLCVLLCFNNSENQASITLGKRENNGQEFRLIKKIKSENEPGSQSIDIVRPQITSREVAHRLLSGPKHPSSTLSSSNQRQQQASCICKDG